MEPIDRGTMRLVARRLCVLFAADAIVLLLARPFIATGRCRG